jgi:hypothetical protein
MRTESDDRLIVRQVYARGERLCLVLRNRLRRRDHYLPPFFFSGFFLGAGFLCGSGGVASIRRSTSSGDGVGFSWLIVGV